MKMTETKTQNASGLAAVAVIAAMSKTYPDLTGDEIEAVLHAGHSKLAETGIPVVVATLREMGSHLHSAATLRGALAEGRAHD